MGKIIFVTGGARSGKSTFAEKYCLEKDEDLGYIATGVAFDEEMKDRIKKHQKQRRGRWTTYERPMNIENVLEEILNNHKIVLLDCLTIYVTNYMFEKNLDFEKIPMDEINKIEMEIQKSLEKIIEIAKRKDSTLLIVSNEIGLGVVPENRMARIYRDYIGRANQICASESEEAYLIVSSIPVKLK